MHIINYRYVLLAIKGSKLAHLWKIILRCRQPWV